MTRKIRLALASVLAVCALGAIAPAANAYVYWSNEQGTIGRASLDGSSPNQSFITGIPAPVAVAVHGDYLYWTEESNQIGRAKLNGTGVNPALITFPPNSGLKGIAVDGTYIYWTSLYTNSIGRAKLNGTGPNQSFITGANGPYGVAVNGNYIYWTNTDTSSIGRATLNGSGAVTDARQSFITGASAPYGVAVDGNHVYWINQGTDTIGRANLDGTSPNQSFITGAPGSFPTGVVADSLPNPIFPNPTLSGVGKPTKTSLKVKVSCGDASACTLQLSGKKVGTNAAITPKSVSVGAGQQPTVTLAYTRALKAALAKGGRVSVTATNAVTGGAKSIVVRVAK
jgi:hypothetical protein